MMRPMLWLCLLAPLALAGCLSFSSSNPPPPAGKTVIVNPPGCPDGSNPPCY